MLPLVFASLAIFADILPFTWADAKEFWNLLGWPGVGIYILFFQILPRLDKHFTAIEGFLDVAKARTISTDDSLKGLNLRTERIEHVLRITKNTNGPAPEHA